MTETTIRRGLKPLLALLLGGIACLMTATVRPVMADNSISVNPFAFFPGGDLASDNTHFVANATWDGAPDSYRDTLTYVYRATFYGANGALFSTQHTIMDYQGGTSTPDSINAYLPFDGWQYADNIYLANYPNVTGFKWSYHLEYSLFDNDTQTDSGLTPVIIDTETQSWGYFAEDATPITPHPK